MQGSYGKEPFDLRLTVLRMMRRLDKIIMVTLAGTLLFGGGYYVKNVLLRGEPQYSAVSTYKIEYADEDWAQNGTYINATTWNTYVHTEEFLEMVQKHWDEMHQEGTGGLQEALGGQTENAGASASGERFKADLPSDLRVMTTTVTASSPESCLETAAAVEAAMTEDFPQVTAEVSSVRVIDSADEALEVIPDVRTGRAFVLSAVLSFFFAMVLFLLKETWDDSIWLPSAMRKRYGLAVLGTVHAKEFAANAAYLFSGMKKIAVVAVDGEINPAEVAAQLAEITGKDLADGAAGQQWIPVPSPLLSPEVCGILREMDGILLAVRAGSHSGKPLEYVLEYLREQDCQVTAAVLWNADELLIRSYYGFRGEREAYEGTGTGFCDESVHGSIG